MDLAPIRGNVNIRLDPATLSANIRLSNFLSSSLLVYRVEPVSMAGSCKSNSMYSTCGPKLMVHVLHRCSTSAASAS